MSTVYHSQITRNRVLRRAAERFVLMLVSILFLLLPIKLIADSNDDTYTQALTAYNTKNYELALSIWRTLAKDGYADAQYALGVAYFKGEGVTRDLGESLHWFELAANAGNPQAMFNLGAAYWEGNGTRQSYSEAVDWWKKAATAGQHASQYNLGLAYYLGKGAEQDLEQALHWIRQAANNNHMGALKVLDVIKKEASKTETEVINDEKAANLGQRTASEESPLIKGEPKDTTVSANYQSAIVSGLGGQAYPDKNSDGTVLANLAGGTPIKILLLEGKWAKVNIPAIASVWVYSKFVHKKDGGSADIQGNRVRARSLPSTGSNSIVIGIFQNNEQVVILNERDSWNQVMAPTRMALWMPIEQLEVFPNVTTNWLAQWQQALSSISKKPTAESVTNSKLAVIANDEYQQSNSLSDASKTEHGAIIQPDFQAAIVSVMSAEAFGTNSLEAPLLKLLLKDTPVKISAIRSPWATIKIAAPINVWVYGKYVSQKGDLAKITGKQVRARSMPSTTSSSTVLGIFEENAPVKVVSKEGDWIRVSTIDVANLWVLVEQLEILGTVSNEWSERWRTAGRKP